MTRLRIPASDEEAKLFLVESEDGGIFLAFDPAEEFDSDEPGLAICVASPDTAERDLLTLRDAAREAFLALGRRRRECAS